ncbi:putative glutathione transferase, partial [Paramicrosporidium saccamoebae]
LAFSTDDKIPGCSPDPVMNAKLLRDLYLSVCPAYKGIFSVPMLWDRKTGEIVNNESLDIMQMFNSNWNDLAKNPQLNLYPDDATAQIEKWFSTTQDNFLKAPGDAFHEEKANQVKDALVELDGILGKSKHDIVSVLLFRINHIFVRDLPNVMRWIKDILNLPGIRNVVCVEHIKGMTFTKKAYNPNGIIPLGNGFTLP